MAKQSGVLIVLTGPSGVGKGTLRSAVCQKFPLLKESISVTTRPQRPEEKDGIDYFFVSKVEFEKMIAKSELLEWAEYAGNLYGTPKDVVEKILSSGGSVLLEIEVQGALNVRKRFPSASLIFIEPPSMAALVQRLRNRSSDAEEDIQRRLKAATWELGQKPHFDYCLTNDNLIECEQELVTLLERLIEK